MIESGARSGEVLNLTRQRVDVEGGYFRVVGGKTKGSNRRVWLSPAAVEVLRRRMGTFKGDYMFPKYGIDGKRPMASVGALQLAARDRAGLPKSFRLYDCRHTFASRLLEAGLDLLTLAAVLGHSNLDQVSIYANPSEARKHEAIQGVKDRARAAG